MELDDNANLRADGAAIETPRGSGRREGMAKWRWLLFAVMARFEVGEDVYLRIPSLHAGTQCRVTDPRRFDNESSPA